MKNKLEIIYITLLIITCIFAFILFGKNIYSPYSDIGRELYISEQVKSGFVLYKDIFNVYFPLGYWLNAIFIKIFGSTLNTFYCVGLVFTILTIIPLFLITKIYTNKHLAFCLLLFILTSCSFYPSISNWITPYSYSILYALCFFSWSLFFLLMYLKKENYQLLYLSAFLIGVSVCFKYEYIGFVLILISLCIYKKNIIKPVFFCLLPPILSLITLLLQGCTINDLIQAFNYMLGIANSVSANYFYQYAGITTSFETVIGNIYKVLHPEFKSLFSIICFVNFVLLIVSILKKKLNISLLLIIGLMASIKSMGGISFEIYGTYFFPILFIGFISFIYGQGGKAKTIVLSLICLFFSILYFNYNLNEQIKYTKITTNKGDIVIPKVFKNSTLGIIEYISKNTNENEIVLILAEGTIINFITERKSDNYLYYLIPPNVDIFDVEFISNKIKEKKIDYIITTNIQYPWYNEKSFMTGWGQKYLNLIQEEYEQIDIVGENLKFYVFKRDIIK